MLKSSSRIGRETYSPFWDQQRQASPVQAKDILGSLQLQINKTLMQSSTKQYNANSIKEEFSEYFTQSNILIFHYPFLSSKYLKPFFFIRRYGYVQKPSLSREGFHNVVYSVSPLSFFFFSSLHFLIVLSVLSSLQTGFDIVYFSETILESSTQSPN